MKNGKKLLAGLLALLLLAALLPLAAFAAETNPELNDAELAKRVSVKQSGSGLALADSTAMLLRRAAVREGAEKSLWRGFTENFVVTANGGSTLSGSRTYSNNGLSYTVKAYKADGMSESGWAALLNEHPEGVVLRFRNEGGEEEKSVLLTHSVNGVFYCLDPDPSTDTGFLDVRASAYGKVQAKFFDSVTYYYAVSSTIAAHTHTYGTTGEQLGVCQTCGYVYYQENQTELSGKGTPAEGLTSFGMKIKPYSASDSLREDGSILRFTSVNVKAVTKNHYGNTWYLVESPDKKYSGYIWEDNIIVSSSSSVIITDVNVPENNAVAGTGARIDVSGSVRATGAPLQSVSTAVFAYDSLTSAELNSILYNTLSAPSLTKLAAKRALLAAAAENIESTVFELNGFASALRFDKLSGGKQYILAVTATDEAGNSTTVFKAFYLSSGIETKSDYTVRLSVAGSVTEYTVSAGASITLPEKSRTGYTFLGWAEGESGGADYAPGTSYKPEADVTLYAVFKSIGAPAVPKLSLTETDAAVGEIVSVQATSSGAESFNAYISAAGQILRTQTFRTGKLSLAFEEAGTYSVNVEAFAGEMGSGASNTLTVHVHAPVTVTFMNGTELWAEQQVDYGGNATEPAQPARPGSSFTGWDGSLENIREDTVLRAEFSEGVYTVTFLDEEGHTLSKQQVAYYGSATAPEAPEKEGYTFLCWDSEAWKCVDSDGLTVRPVYAVQADREAFSCTLDAVETVGSGRLVTYTVTNTTDETLSAQAVLQGKSAAAEVLGTSTGSALLLGAGESFTERVYVYGTKAVLWEMTVYDRTGDASLSDAALLLGSGDGKSVLWVSESELKQLGVSYKKLEESKQYSTSSTESYTTSATSFLDWDKKSGSGETVWGAWSDWQSESVGASGNIQVEKRQVVTVPAHIEYRYGRWYAEDVTRTATDETHALAVSPSLAYAKSVFKNASTSFSKQFSAWSTARLSASDTFRTKLKDNEATYASATSGAYNWNVYYLGAPSENTRYFWEESRSVSAVKETQYRYRVKLEGEESNVFTHKKAAAWSFASQKNASTRKVYKVSFTGIGGGKTVMLNGSLGSAAANRDAVLSVSMSDGNGHENTYTERVRLNSAGEYSFEVADLSVLSVISAPCYVKLNVAGATQSVCIATFTSGASSAEVQFADGLTGELLSTETVSRGASAQAPAAQAHEGYLFAGWNRTPAAITEDTVIIAEYVKETFSVIFSDSVSGTETAVSGIPYGRAVTAPEVTAPEGFTFLGWSVSEGKDLNTVTSSMRAEAVYAENTHTVTYLSAPKGYDSSGMALTDTLASVTVRDGAYVSAPEFAGSLHIPDSMYFIGWSQGAEEPVTSDLILVPLLGCIMDADEIVPSLPGGLYAEGTKVTLNASDTEKLTVRYRFNTAKETGSWTDYDIKKSPVVTLSSTGVMEIEASAPDKNTSRVKVAYTLASSSALPAAPTIKSAAQTDSETVKVTWGAVKNASGYILTRESDCGEVCTHMLTGTSYEDEGLRPQRTYTYSVSAYTMSEKSGSAFMLAGKSSKTASVRFYGAEKPVTKITVKGPTTVYTDSSAQLETVITPSDAAEQNVYWTVDSGSSHGTVSADGVFTPLSAGSVTVSARALDGSGVSGTLKLTVKEPEVNTAKLSVSTASAQAGNTAAVTVSLSKDSMARSARFTIKYNSSKLTLNSAKKGTLLSGKSPSINTKTKGYVIFSYEGDTLTDSGTLLTLNFSVKSSATGSAYVQIQTENEGYDLELIDKNGRTVEVAVKNGSVSIRDAILGDVDGSGTVDVGDAYLVRSYINGDTDFDEKQKQAADVNGDGKINSTDIALIRKYVVKLISTFPAED